MHRDTEGPLRYTALLGSLNCWLCGSTTFADCDIAVHRNYANARYGCSACDAAPGEACHPGCRAASTVFDLLNVLQQA
jgi:hypothetical protein